MNLITNKSGFVATDVCRVDVGVALWLHAGEITDIAFLDHHTQIVCHAPFAEDVVAIDKSATLAP